MTLHISAFNRKKNKNIGGNCSIYEILKNNSYKPSVVQKVYIESAKLTPGEYEDNEKKCREELHTIELKWILKTKNCVNLTRPKKSNKISSTVRLVMCGDKYFCSDCNRKYSYSEKSKHLKSGPHLQYIYDQLVESSTFSTLEENEAMGGNTTKRNITKNNDYVIKNSY